MQSVQFVCHSVWVQRYCKSDRPISLKLDVMIGRFGPTNQKNRLTFGADPFLDTDSRSLLHFRHQCGDF